MHEIAELAFLIRCRPVTKSEAHRDGEPHFRYGQRLLLIGVLLRTLL